MHVTFFFWHPLSFSLFGWQKTTDSKEAALRLMVAGDEFQLDLNFKFITSLWQSWLLWTQLFAAVRQTMVHSATLTEVPEFGWCHEWLLEWYKRMMPKLLVTDNGGTLMIALLGLITLRAIHWPSFLLSPKELETVGLIRWWSRLDVGELATGRHDINSILSNWIPAPNQSGQWSAHDPSFIWSSDYEIDIDKSTQLNSDDLEHQKIMCEQSPICSAYFGGIQHTVFQSSAIGKIGLSVGCAKQVNIQKLQSALQSNSPEFILIFGT